MIDYIFYFLIYIAYPSEDINTVRYYNKVVNDAMQSYCFLEIEYDLTSKLDSADLIFFPESGIQCWEYLGLTFSNIHKNPKVYGTPKILTCTNMSEDYLPKVLLHEIGHFLGYKEHSPDPMSIYYDSLHEPELQVITRHDTILLYNITRLR